MYNRNGVAASTSFHQNKDKASEEEDDEDDDDDVAFSVWEVEGGHGDALPALVVPPLLPEGGAS